MPIKLNSFILPDSIIKKMKDKIEDARIKDVEVGFNLCAEDNELYDESHCVGTECEIEMPEKCSRGTKVGIFHTHSESLQPSMSDIAHAYKFGMNCIGTVETKKIRCHIRKDKTHNEKDRESIISNIVRFEDPLSYREDLESYRRWIRARNILQDKYLNFIDII